jgi:ATP synthase protein I
MEEGPDPVMVSMARYSGYGLQLAASVGLFMAGGWWLDGKLGTKPLLTILGALLGGGAGFYSLYQHLVKNRDQDQG